jgi:ATP-dependent helicase/nuclease subunit A
MLDMVMPAALNGHHLPDIEKELISPLWKIRFVRPVGANVSNQAAVTSIPIPRGTVSATDFDKEWNHSENSTSLPAKTSVTSVLQGKFAMLEENESATNNNDDAQDQEVSSFLLPEEPEKPRFLQPLTEKTSANIGTIYHRFMRLIDLKRFTNLVACNDYLDTLENELADMVNNNVFEEDEASTIRKGLKGIASFLMSRLGQIISSGNVKVTREKGFVVQLRIGKEALLVQGVIDVLYQKENGHWVIIDYKTDQDTRQEVMIQKHKGQLNCYRHAVEHVTNLPVDGMWIVSLRTGECYQAPKENNPLCS